MRRAKAQGGMRADATEADVRDDDVRRQRGDAAQPGAGRVAALPHADAGRAARIVVSAAMAAERSRRSRGREGSPGTSSRCSTARGEGAAGVEALLDEAQRRAERVRRRARRQGRRARRRRARRARCASSPRCRSSSAARAPTRCCASRPPPPTPSAARCCSACRSAARRSRRALLFFELEWAALDDERAEALLAARRARLLPPPPALARGATARTCCPSPRSGSSPRSRSPAAARGRACSRSRPRRSRSTLPDARRAGRARDRARRGCSRPTATSAARRPRRSPRRSQPGLRVRGYVLNTLLADKAVDDRLRSYPHWLASRNLANEASDESVAGARRGGPRPLRAAAPLVPAQGAAARRRPARRLRPHGRGHRRRRVDRRGPTRSDIVLDSFAGFSPELADTARAFFDERRIDAPVRPGQARRRVLRLHGAERAPVRAAQLHGAPPRRADARARARPRRARVARAPRRACSTSRRR